MHSSSALKTVKANFWNGAIAAVPASAAANAWQAFIIFDAFAAKSRFQISRMT